MYCESRTIESIASRQPADTQLAPAHSPDGSTFLREMTSWPPSLKYDAKSKIRLRQSMRFTWRTIPPNFIPIPFETREP